MASIKAKNVNHPGYSENLNEQKYTLIRDAIHAVLPTESGMTFNDMEAGVHKHLDGVDFPPELFPKPGSVRWYCKTVQLDLEARGEIERLPKTSPMQLRRIETDEEAE